MRHRHLFPTLVLSLFCCLSLGLALSGCNKTSSNHDRSKVDEGNRKTERMEQIRRDLLAKGVFLATQSKANNDTLVEKMRPVFKNSSDEDLATLDALTMEYAQAGTEVLKLINDKDVTYGGNRDDLIRWIKAAKILNAEIQEEIKSRTKLQSECPLPAEC